MTYGAFTQDFASYEYGGRSRKPIPQIGLCLLALGLTTSVGVWALRAHMNAPAQIVPTQIAMATPAPLQTATRTAAVVPAAMPRKVSSVFKGPTKQLGILDPNLTSQFAAVVFARTTSLRAGMEPNRPQASAQVAVAPQAPAQPQLASASPVSSEPQVSSNSQISSKSQISSEPQSQVASLTDIAPSSAVVSEAPAPQIALPAAVAPQVELSPLVKDVPLPQPRPHDLTPSKVALAPMPGTRRPLADDATPSVAPAAPGRPSFFEKLFGRSDRNGPALAYASPEDGVIGNVLSNTGRPAPVDRFTAVYNITTHTVTLPDGTQLEAHSGLGAAKDNPRMVTLRMVGATPPNVYDLTVREAPFHGVRALRLTPTGGTTFGRAGLLAHTYMLRGRSGESNGCVVFRDYQAFLRAYESGSIRRLAVVSGA